MFRCDFCRGEFEFVEYEDDDKGVYKCRGCGRRHVYTLPPDEQVIRDEELAEQKGGE